MTKKSRKKRKRDTDDQKQVTVLILVIAVVAIITLGVLGFFGWTVVYPIVYEATAAGLGLKTSAVIAFGVTAGLLVIFAIAAGDGLLGEIQYMIGAFGIFFVFLWLGIAWIF